MLSIFIDSPNQVLQTGEDTSLGYRYIEIKLSDSI